MRRALFALLAALCLLTTAASAEDGAGKAQPLALSSSSVADGATNVAADTAIRLDFTKNVVNLTVKDNNKTCFSVTDSTGAAVPIVVSMGDDQVDRDVRNTIYVSPAQTWPAEETLTLTISGDLMAKNGTSMGTAHTLRFTVAGAAATPAPTATPKPTPAPTPTPKPTARPTPTPAAAMATPEPEVTATPEPTPSATPEPTPTPEVTEAPEESTTPSASPTETPEPTAAPEEEPEIGVPLPVMAAVIGVVVVLGAGLLFLTRKLGR